MSEPTKDRLARELRKQANPLMPSSVDFWYPLADRAATGEFDDYADVHVCGPTALHSILVANGKHSFAHRVASGEFDASWDESEAWARYQTDPETVALMEVMGITPYRSRDQ